ncbi:head-tail adaptor protein [Bacillus glycinifermentans]|uniref:Head-tail adaptor protein n=3 Tax=Bacillaceae TaxID=186817 RepID=A0AAJ3Z0Z5_9BACI|nr:head-tail adaptor protein [Bacillus glycinifermentans]
MVMTMPVNPGKLKHKIEIQRQVLGRNPETMKPEYNWSTFTKAWAEIMQPRDRYIIQASAAHQEKTVWFRIRHRKDIESGSMRVVYKGQPFKIEEVIPDLQNQELMTLQCVGWDHENSSSS